MRAGRKSYETERVWKEDRESLHKGIIENVKVFDKKSRNEKTKTMHKNLL